MLQREAALGTVERIKSPLALKEAELVVEVGHLPQKIAERRKKKKEILEITDI